MATIYSFLTKAQIENKMKAAESVELRKAVWLGLGTNRQKWSHGSVTLPSTRKVSQVVRVARPRSPVANKGDDNGLVTGWPRSLFALAFVSSLSTGWFFKVRHNLDLLERLGLVSDKS
jgi:hypothetical protein